MERIKQIHLEDEIENLSVTQGEKANEEVEDGVVGDALPEVQESLDNKQNSLDARIVAVLAKAQNEYANPDQKSHFQRILEKTKKISRAGLRASAGVSVLFVAIVAADHSLTRWEVTHEVDSQTSRLKYKHEDPETTHVINVLSGEERLTEEEELALIKESLTEDDYFPYLVANGIWESSSEELVHADRQTVINLLKSLRRYKDKIYKNETIEKNDEQYLKDYFKLEPGIEDDLVNETLWRLMEKAGNPKLRFSNSAGLFKKYGTGHYNPLTNTVYITPQNSRSAIQTMIAELSHGKQFKEKPYYNSLIGIRDFISVAKNSVVHFESLGESYDRLYEEKGAFEYQAHEEIEPVLTKEYEENTKEGPIAKRVEESKKQSLAERAQLEKDLRKEQGVIWDKQSEEELKIFQKRNNEFRRTRSLTRIREIADRYDVLIEEIKANAFKEIDELDKKYRDLKARKGIM